jgi:hypothetical protein
MLLSCLLLSVRIKLIFWFQPVVSFISPDHGTRCVSYVHSRFAYSKAQANGTENTEL